MNFLALLGWSPGNDQELFTRDELVAAFSLEGISSSNAVFNPEKLEWFSAQHIARMPAAELVRADRAAAARGRACGATRSADGRRPGVAGPARSSCCARARSA